MIEIDSESGRHLKRNEEARKHFRILEVVAWLVLSFIECSEPS
jgi:hypothetical protein